MKKSLLAALVWGSLCLPALSAEQVLELTNGRSQIVKTDDAIVRVSITDPKIADVVTLPNREVMINGKTHGSTTLIIWTKSSRQVFQVRVQPDLSRLLPTLIETTGSERIQVHVANEALILTGRVDSPHLSQLAEQVASQYLPKVINRLEVAEAVSSDREPQIQVGISVVEVAKSASHELGIEWGSRQVTEIKNGVEQFEFHPLVGIAKEQGPTAPLLGINNLLRDPFMAKLNLLMRDNKARILARPTLVAQSGADAKFLAGGEIPIPVVQSLGTTTVLWKEYGVKLETRPTAMANGDIVMLIKPEVSSLDFTNAIDLNGYRIPAIKTRKAETQVRLRDGQSLILGGLMASDQAEAVMKLPILGDIPILGELFKSHQFQNGETELLIAVTPRVVEPGPSEQVEQEQIKPLWEEKRRER